MSIATEDDEASAEITVENVDDEEGDTDPQEDEGESTSADNDDSEPQEEDDGQVADEEIPGFGVGSALAGLGGAAYFLKRRLRDTDTEK